MTLIDTSAWIEFFRRSGHPEVKKRVAALIERDEAAYTCPVYFEILSGARPTEIEDIEETLSFCQRLIFQADYWKLAAETQRHLLAKGITVPRDDLFVAVTASSESVKLMCRDAHFDMIAAKSGLKLTVEQV